MMITPEEFEKQMREIANTKTEYPEVDMEINHVEADRLMVRVLNELGYQKGTRIFEEMRKWYA